MKTSLTSLLLGSAALSLVLAAGFEAPGRITLVRTAAAQEASGGEIDAARQRVEAARLAVEQAEAEGGDLAAAEADLAAAQADLAAAEAAAATEPPAADAEPAAEAPPVAEEELAPEAPAEPSAAEQPGAAAPADEAAGEPAPGETATEEPAPDPAAAEEVAPDQPDQTEPETPAAEAPPADPVEAPEPPAGDPAPEPAADEPAPEPAADEPAPALVDEDEPDSEPAEAQTDSAAPAPAEAARPAEAGAAAQPPGTDAAAPAAAPEEDGDGAAGEAPEAVTADDAPAETLSREDLEAAQRASEAEAVEEAAAEEAAKSEEERNRERADRLRILGAAAAGVAVGAILPEIGGRLIGQQGDRVIIQQGDDFIVRKDETERLLTGGGTATVEELAEGRTQVTVDRPDGTQIVTLRDAGGTLLRRVRRLPNGDEVVLFDERDSGAATVADLDERLPFIPPEERGTTYLSRASVAEILEALSAQPRTPVEGSYTLREVRQSERLRWQVPSLALDAVTFETASAELGADQITALDAMGRALAEFIGERPGEVFLIEGHTDATGADLYNLTLSDRRAETVAQLLTDFYDVPPENLITQGYGEQDLRVATLGSSRENRRVEVRRITPLLQ